MSSSYYVNALFSKYTAGGSLTIYQSPFSSGYSLGSDAYNLHCSSFDQNIPVLCNELTKPSCEKAEESNLHNQAEPNFRIYPWMNS
nr:PREDICTED: homeobox protein Hox-A7-like [Balearica regulorum gibbericeps]